MVQLVSGDITTKSQAEFDVKFLHGTPYCVIFINRISEKERIYLLDTRENLYYPLAEWDCDDRESYDKWYQYLLAVNNRIRGIRLVPLPKSSSTSPSPSP